MARRQIPRGIRRRNTAIKIKIGYMAEWTSKEEAVKALVAIGYGADEAVHYLLTPTPHVHVIRA